MQQTEPQGGELSLQVRVWHTPLTHVCPLVQQLEPQATSPEEQLAVQPVRHVPVNEPVQSPPLKDPLIVPPLTLPLPLPPHALPPIFQSTVSPTWFPEILPEQT